MAVALTYSKEPLNSTEIELEVDGPDQEVSDAMGLESVSPDEWTNQGHAVCQFLMLLISLKEMAWRRLS
ncbi:hypothetical protein ABFA07_007655 [Porites harrisoni]